LNNRDPEKVTEGHSIWYHLKEIGCGFLFAFYSNYGPIGLSLTVNIRYSASKNSVALKTKLGVVHGHWKWRRSIDHIRLSICSPL